ncbi:MAG: SRPBCC family protein [Actinomycetota bacterium]
MGTFTVRRVVAAPAATVWAMLVDWPSHGRWVPFTTVTTTSASATGVGASFVGRSGIGPIGFDDPMVVTAWQPPDDVAPGLCGIRKIGRIVQGDAQFSVTPLGPARCEVLWSESIEIAGVRRLPLAGRLNDLIGRLTFAAVIKKMAAEAEATQPGPA